VAPPPSTTLPGGLGARRVSCSPTFGSTTGIAAHPVRSAGRDSLDFGHSRPSYDPRVSWPYPKCVGVRSDGECCQARAGRDGLYCHHHDPARASSRPRQSAAAIASTTPTATAAMPDSSSAPGHRIAKPAEDRGGRDRGSVPDATTFAAFTEAFRRARERRRSSGIDSSNAAPTRPSSAASQLELTTLLTTPTNAPRSRERSK
jgi:hypothetical protein